MVESITQEDGFDILMEDGDTLVTEDSTDDGAVAGDLAFAEDADTFTIQAQVSDPAPGPATGDLTLTEPADTFVIQAQASAPGPATGDLALVEPADTITVFGEGADRGLQTRALTATAVAGRPQQGVATKALTGLAVVQSTTRLSTRALTGTTVVSATTALSTRALHILALVGPPILRQRDPIITRPERIRPPAVLTPRKQVLAPRKALPQPPKGYDPDWMETNQSEVLKHLDNTISAVHSNASIPLHDEYGNSYEVKIVNGELKLIPRKG